MLGKRVSVLIGMLLCLLTVQAQGGQQAGIDWLRGRLTADGHFENSTGIATDFQAASAALAALHATEGDAALEATFDFLNTHDYDSSENLSRKIIAGRSLNKDVSGLVARLAGTQNLDGGFGELAGFDSTVLDTAWALDALAVAGQTDTSVTGLAVQYLLDRQRDDGGWNGNAGDASLYVSAVATHAIWLYRHTFEITAAIDKAVQHLLAARGADGLWPEPFLSALVLRVAAPAVTDAAAIGTSRDALAAQQLADGSWSDDVFVTALALRALQAVRQGDPDLGTIRGRIIDGDYGYPVAGISVQLAGPTSLTVETDSQGYFEFGDVLPGVYTVNLTSPDYPPLEVTTTLKPGATRDFGTIRLLRAADSTTARVTGTVTDAATGTPIAGADVRVLDTGINTATGADGQYVLAGIAPGDAVIEASKTGYQTSRTIVHLEANETLLLSPVLSVPANPTFSLSGTVTDGTTGEPLDGASVTVTGDASATAQTDASGAYRLSGLTSGGVTVSVALAGYHPAEASFVAESGAQFKFSPGLYPVDVTPPEVHEGGVIGRAVDASSNLPLTGVTVSIIVDGVTATATSDKDGAFAFHGIHAGDGQITFVLDGYKDKRISIPLPEGITVDIGTIALRPAGTVEPATAVGIVVDSITNKPLAGTSISVTFNNETHTYTSGTDGRFQVDAIAETSGDIIFSVDGYRQSDFPIYLENGINDLGQIRLRKANLDSALPDLVIKNIDRANAHTDAHTLQLNGALNVTIGNEGHSGTGSYNALAFYDINHDGVYKQNEDVLLGVVPVSSSVAGQTVTIGIPVAGQLPFRDAPLSVWLDSDRKVVEESENNNVATTAEFCKIFPTPAGELDLKLKWRWNGDSQYPSVRDVLGPVAVGELSDDNGDGIIDVHDTPDVVFAAGTVGSGHSTKDILYALSGDTGKLIWKYSDRSVSQRGAPALADIDGDGVVEILIVDQHRTKLFAFENDGTLKWEAPTGPRYTSDGASDAITVADLNYDGSPEIINGNRVFNADGSLRWIGSGDAGGSRYGGAFRDWGYVPIAADVNLTGQMEVIAGRTLYSSDGRIIWYRRDIPNDGFNAVGNFDDDDQAEIVLVSGGMVYLLNDTGTTIWKVAIPGGGRGGPPTVADFDGDGEPEIGVAAARRYVVYDTDGSILWTSPIQDLSSNMTGSSLFDFDADGKAEVLYSDEINFHIYDGETGKTLVKIHNTSVTTLEYPSVVDVDGDGHAEIIVTANDYGPNPTHGIRVYEAANGEWAPTRAIWNEHAYHIDNINDDGTVPVHEKPSWLSHNTYRLNTFADRNPLLASDLSVSLLRVVDNGFGQPRSLTARVGNAGAVAVSAGVKITFYDGDPSQGAASLGSVTLDAFPPGHYQDVRLDDVPPFSGTTVFAVVDPDDGISECDEANNSMSAPAAIASESGDVSVTTDRSRYAPASTVHVMAPVVNTGSFAGDFSVDLRIEDQTGALVADLGTQALETLAPGAATQVSADWSAGAVLAGAYRARAVLRTGDGASLDEAVSVFEVTPSTASGAIADLRTTTDRPAYNVTDTAKLSNLVRNLSTNALIRGTVLNLEISDPGGSTVFTTSRQLGDLPASGDKNANFVYAFTNAPTGTYQVTAMLLNAEGTQIAADTAEYNVAIQLDQAVAGSVTARPSMAYIGDSIICTDTLTDRTPYALSGLDIRQIVVSLTAGASISQSQKTIDLNANADQALIRNVPTVALAPGDYACALELKVDGQWRPLAHAAFHLSVPPIVIGSTFTQTGHGRLLVLLDAPARDDQGHVTDDRDPHGPPFTPGLSEQRDWLEQVLDDAGWSYTIVTTADDFEHEFDTHGYVLYALSSEQVKLPEALQHQLVDAIDNGAGLLIAGSHDRRNGRLEAALGIKSLGHNPHVGGIDIQPFGTFPGGGELFPLDNKPLTIRLQGATALGSYRETGPGKGHGGSQPPAVTFFTPTQGRSMFVGFDLLQQATADDNRQLLLQLLTAALSYSHPATLAPYAGSVLPLTINLSNRSLAADGRVTVTLPMGAVVVDPGIGQVNAQGQPVWNFVLDVAQTQTWRFWVRMPPQPGTAVFNAAIETGQAPDYKPYGTIQTAIRLVPRP